MVFGDIVLVGMLLDGGCCFGLCWLLMLVGVMLVVVDDGGWWWRWMLLLLSMLVFGGGGGINVGGDPWVRGADCGASVG